MAISPSHTRSGRRFCRHFVRTTTTAELCGQGGRPGRPAHYPDTPHEVGSAEVLPRRLDLQCFARQRIGFRVALGDGMQDPVVDEVPQALVLLSGH